MQGMKRKDGALAVRVPIDVKKALETQAASLDQSMSGYLRQHLIALAREDDELELDIDKSDGIDPIEHSELRSFAEEELARESEDLTDELKVLLPKYSTVKEKIRWIRSARSLGLCRRKEGAEKEHNMKKNEIAGGGNLLT